MTIVATPVYRFGEFDLDPASRELRRNGREIVLPVKVFACVLFLIENRHRAVERDELMRAVWGHVHLTESVLGQVIRQARQTLCDTGEDQRTIKTMRGFGYRWVAPVEQVPAQLPATPLPTQGHGSRGSAPRFHTALALALGATVAGLIITAAILRAPHTATPSTAGSASESETSAPIAVLLPVAGADGPDDAWIRLGLMDFIADRLRADGQPMVPTDTVILMMRGSASARAPDNLPMLTASTRAKIVLEADAEKHGETWRVSMHSVGDRRPSLRAVGEGDDVLTAARRAADDIAVSLGHIPATSPDELGVPALLVQRINAAMLMQNRDLARRLIEEAPPELREMPEIRHQLARIDFYDRDLAGAQSIFESLLKEVSAERNPELRARVLNGLAVVHVVHGDRALAEPLFEEAARLLERHDSGSMRDTLGTIWMNLGNVAQERGDVERARDRMARARRMFEGTGDVRNLAQLDLNVGVLEARRERYADALHLFENAARLHAAIQDDGGELTALCYVVQAKLLLLDPAAANSAEARIAELSSRTTNPDLRGRARLSLADLYEATGRRRASNALLSELLATPDTDVNLEVVGADIMARRAEHAEEERKPELAAQLAGDLVERLKTDTDGVLAENRSRVWLVLIRSDIALGRFDAAARAAADLAAWSRSQQAVSPRIYAALGTAEVAAATGKPDAAGIAFDQALALADESRVPLRLLQVVEPYADWLLHRDASAARDERLSRIVERIANYADRDFAAALVQLRAYRTLGPSSAWQSALARARSLAGERRIPSELEPAS